MIFNFTFSHLVCLGSNKARARQEFMNFEIQRRSSKSKMFSFFVHNSYYYEANAYACENVDDDDDDANIIVCFITNRLNYVKMFLFSHSHIIWIYHKIMSFFTSKHYPVQPLLSCVCVFVLSFFLCLKSKPLFFASWMNVYDNLSFPNT